VHNIMRYYTQRRGTTVDITETTFVRPVAALLKAIEIAEVTDHNDISNGMLSLFSDLSEFTRLYVEDISMVDDATVLLLSDIVVNRGDDHGLDESAKGYIIGGRKQGLHPVEIAHDFIEHKYQHKYDKPITHDLIMKELKEEYDDVLFAAISFVFAEELENQS
jgi:hypothetical protein